MTLALARPVADNADVALDRTTEETLVRSHLPLVGHLVREVAARVPAHVSRDALQSAAMYALATSARAFDADHGNTFATFASVRIRGALLDELRSMDWASRGVRGKAREIDTTRQALTHLLGRTPSTLEVAESMGVTTSQLARSEADVHRSGVLSLQALPSEDGGTALATRGAGPEDLLLRREQLGYLRDAIAELPQRLRIVVEDYFFGQRLMADIASDLGVTESRVSQLRSEALRLLRAGMRDLDQTGPATETAVGRRAAATRSYVSAVANRSTTSGRLSAASLMGDYCA